MTAPGRRTALCAQAVKALTGIDFVQVVDPAVQTRLRVFFIIEPTATVPAIVAAAAVPALPPPPAIEGAPVAVGAPLAVALATAAEGRPLPIVALNWRRLRLFDTTRVVLEIDVAEPGGFEPCRLTIDHPRMDRLAGTILFDFKQACPTGFDCEAERACPDDPPVDVPIDYLARDFDSLRAALLDFAAARYPDWREPLEADTGVMLMEVMAALGDEFAYQQDRIDAETRFATATQRASLAALAKLVDYRVDRGSPARGEIVVNALTGGDLPVHTRFWARPDATSALPFSTTDPSRKPNEPEQDFWVHPRWNSFPAHNPDPGKECLDFGATTLMLKSTAEVLIPPETPGGITREEFLVGKRVMLLSDPADPSRPKRAYPVTITRIEEFTDNLVLTAGNPTFVTQIHWDRSEATPVDLPFDGLSVAMNLVPVAAGEAVDEYFRVGPEDAIAARYPAVSAELRGRMQKLISAVEREGPINAARDGREAVYRYGLRATEGQSLRHGAGNLPEITLTEMMPPPVPPVPLPPDDGDLFGQFDPDPDGDEWAYLDDLLDGDLDDTNFTLEPGMWRTIVTHQLPFGEIQFQDYAANSGWTVRFGSGGFGRGPQDGAIIRARFRTDPGVTANIASEALSLQPPPGEAVPPAVLALIDSATNPLPFGNARAEEEPAVVRLNAPEYYRATPRRAVRPEDYSAIIQRMNFVQRANSVTRWTGSWSTDFVAVDPLDSIALTGPQQFAVEAEIECIRLATRDGRRVDADYLDIDIEIIVCVAADAYAAEVVEAIGEAIAAPGFFDPDNFTFGTPLSRSALEAAVQAVPGVRFVDAINIRIPGLGDWRPFSEPELLAGPNQIIRLQNDPDRAAMGLLRIKSHGGR